MSLRLSAGLGSVAINSDDGGDAKLANLAELIQIVKREVLCEIEPLGCMSREHYNLMLAALDSASAHANLACYFVRRQD